MNWKKVIRDLRARGWTPLAIANQVGASQTAIRELLSGAIKEPAYSRGALILALFDKPITQPSSAPAASQRARATPQPALRTRARPAARKAA